MSASTSSAFLKFSIALGSVAEALVVQAGQAHQQGALQLARQVAGDRLLEQRGVVRVAVLEVGELLELGLRGLVARVVAERAAVGVERRGGVADVVGQDGADLQQQADALVDGPGRGDLDLERLDHLRPVEQALVDREQDAGHRGLERVVLEATLEPLARLLVGGVDVEDLAEQVDGVGRRVQLVLLDDAEAEQQGRAGLDLVGRGDLELAAARMSASSVHCPDRGRGGRGRRARSGPRRRWRARPRRR